VLYLAFMGCLQPCRGWGTKMLRHLAKVADAQHKWIYLDAATERTADLFRRHGFREVGGCQVGGKEGRRAGAPAPRVLARPPGAREEGTKQA
jgi:hypothetical protein